MLIAFNKPYGVLSQFTSAEGKRTLADFISIASVYPAGRLDLDSEGLLLLTDEGALQHAIADPLNGLAKRYWTQVEGVPDAAALQPLESGIEIGSGDHRYRALPASVTFLVAPSIEERVPPIRWRANIPTSWLDIRIVEGKNRQVRRMTAAIGHPTLRLIRVGIGNVELSTLGLAPGAWREIESSGLVLPTPQPDAVAGVAVNRLAQTALLGMTRSSGGDLECHSSQHRDTDSFDYY